MTAQSCASLAESMQIFAERSLTVELECRESTYKQLLDSAAMLRALLDNIRLKLDDNSSEEAVSVFCVLSDHMVEEIRFMLAQDQATTSVGCTTSTERVETMLTADAGDMK
jgi:dsDNA-binding SOS-regulon protein